jgi:hypothetical protein
MVAGKIHIPMLFIPLKGLMFPQSAPKNCNSSKRGRIPGCGEDDIAELLESHSLPLTNEELVELDKQMYKEAQDDDNNVISEEKTLIIKGLREAFSKIDEAVDYFRNHDTLYDHSAKVECELRDVLLCYKEILQAKMRAGTQPTLDLFSAKHKQITV